MRPLSLAFGLAGLLLAGAAWSAPRIPSVAPPSAVRAGSEYVTEVPALPRGVEEFELFLLPEDGSGRMIRLTREHEGSGGSLRWRMPRIEASRAQLVLRAGGRFGETESEPSAPFAVEAAAPRALADVLRGEDELDWQFGEAAAAPPALRVPPGAATIDPATLVAVAVEPTRDAGAEPPASVVGPVAPQAPVRLPAPPAPARSRRPAFVPLRN